MVVRFLLPLVEIHKLETTHFNMKPVLIAENPYFKCPALF